MKKIIVVAGLGIKGPELEVVIAWWKKEGLEPIVFVPEWENDEDMEIKLKKLVDLIDSQNENILLVGISAGASLALNAFFERKNKIDKYVSVCGRLRMGFSKDVIQRKLQEETLKRKAFKQSVELLESRMNELTGEDKKRILTVSSQLGDELIPIETSQIDGATNILVPTLTHVISITSALTNNFEPIKKFLIK